MINNTGQFCSNLNSKFTVPSSCQYGNLEILKCNLHILKENDFCLIQYKAFECLPHDMSLFLNYQIPLRGVSELSEVILI